MTGPGVPEREGLDLEAYLDALGRKARARTDGSRTFGYLTDEARYTADEDHLAYDRRLRERDRAIERAVEAEAQVEQAQKRERELLEALAFADTGFNEVLRLTGAGSQSGRLLLAWQRKVRRRAALSHLQEKGK